MTDTDLYQIVKDHREAWPEDARFSTNGEGMPRFRMWGAALQQADLMFEASFHRALMKRGDVYTRHTQGLFTVQVGDKDFDAGSLIEAYAKALEWLK